MEYEEFLFAGEGKRCFTLSEDSISLSRRHGKRGLILLLKEFEPEYQLVRRRLPAYHLGLASLVSAVVLAAGECAGFPFRSLGLELPYLLAVVMALIGLLVLFFSWRKVDVAVFKNTAGTDRFEIARAGPDRSTFYPFVDEVSRRIRQVRGEQS